MNPTEKGRSRLKAIRNVVLIVLLMVLVAGYLWSNQDRFFQREPTTQERKQFAEQIGEVLSQQKWRPVEKFKPKVKRKDLIKSFRLGRDYLVANQQEEGNFNYEYDFVTEKMKQGDNQVRQAGALWGLALCHQYEPRKKTRRALEKGFDFFFGRTKIKKDGQYIIHYSGQPIVLSGTVALVCLAIIDYLRSDDNLTPDRRAELEAYLDGYLNFLRSLQFRSGTFSTGVVSYLHAKIGRSNQYFDGETLLAMCKAAKYLNRTDLIPVIEKAAAAMAPKYTVRAWEDEPDSNLTKGFYQWSSMSFWEYQDAGWYDAQAYADTTLALAWWMIFTHDTLRRTRNTGYAYEGLIHAYRIARDRGYRDAVNRLRYTIDRGMYKLTAMQVGGPLARKNKFLRRNPTKDPLAVGGVMNGMSAPGLRIDVTQHQMHAVILALQHVYPE